MYRLYIYIKLKSGFIFFRSTIWLKKLIDFNFNIKTITEQTNKYYVFISSRGNIFHFRFRLRWLPVVSALTAASLWSSGGISAASSDSAPDGALSFPADSHTRTHTLLRETFAAPDNNNQHVEFVRRVREAREQHEPPVRPLREDRLPHGESELPGQGEHHVTARCLLMTCVTWKLRKKHGTDAWFN